MKKEYLAIATAYVIGSISFFIQYNGSQEESFKGIQVLSIICGIVLCSYAVSKSKRKCFLLVSFPALILSGWGFAKFALLFAAMFLSVVIGGHTP